MLRDEHVTQLGPMNTIWRLLESFPSCFSKRTPGKNLLSPQKGMGELTALEKVASILTTVRGASSNKTPTKDEQQRDGKRLG